MPSMQGPEAGSALTAAEQEIRNDRRKGDVNEKVQGLRSRLLEIQQNVGHMSSARAGLEHKSSGALAWRHWNTAEHRSLASSHAEMMQQLSHLISSDSSKAEKQRSLGSGVTTASSSTPKELVELQAYVERLKAEDWSLCTEIQDPAFLSACHLEAGGYSATDSASWIFADHGGVTAAADDSYDFQDNTLDVAFERSSSSSHMKPDLEKTGSDPCFSENPVGPSCQRLFNSIEPSAMDGRAASARWETSQPRARSSREERPSHDRVTPQVGPLPCGVPVLFRPYEDCQFPSLPQGSLMAMSGFGPCAKDDALIGAIVAGSALPP